MSTPELPAPPKIRHIGEVKLPRPLSTRAAIWQAVAVWLLAAVSLFWMILAVSSYQHFEAALEEALRPYGGPTAVCGPGSEPC